MWFVSSCGSVIGSVVASSVARDGCVAAGSSCASGCCYARCYARCYGYESGSVRNWGCEVRPPSHAHTQSLPKHTGEREGCLMRDT